MGFDTVKKNIIYKATHRGSKEADLLLGPFCRAVVDTLEKDHLEDLLRILEQDDSTLFTRLKQENAPLTEMEKKLKAFLWEKGWTGRFL